MGDHAVVTIVGRRCRHHNHLALGFTEPAVFLHQRIVMGKESTKLIRTVSQREKDIGNETGFLLHFFYAQAYVLRYIRKFRHWKTTDRDITHLPLPAG